MPTSHALGLLAARPPAFCFKLRGLSTANKNRALSAIRILFLSVPSPIWLTLSCPAEVFLRGKVYCTLANLQRMHKQLCTTCIRASALQRESGRNRHLFSCSPAESAFFGERFAHLPSIHSFGMIKSAFQTIASDTALAFSLCLRVPKISCKSNGPGQHPVYALEIFYKYFAINQPPRSLTSYLW